MNTQDSRGYSHVTESIVRMLRQREYSDSSARSFQKAAHITEGMIRRLGLWGQLQAHKGCVNCLEWSDDGRLLISGSDDTQVIIWDPMKMKSILKLPTRHIGNIFSVKFLPKTNCSKVVTGAGDSFIIVINVEYEGCASLSATALRKMATPILHCRCHSGRVKRIATAPDIPDVFWSAGEDGLIMQFDLRMPHTCGTRSEHGRGTVLVDLSRHVGLQTEAKCVSINAAKPHLIAVGANDSYARLYDRRMLKTSPFESSADRLDREVCIARISVPDESIPTDSANYFIPGHLGDTPDRNYRFATTYVSFSPCGNEMLVNLGGDHIYLYDINKSYQSVCNFVQKLMKPPTIDVAATDDDDDDDDNICKLNEFFTRKVVIKECCTTLTALPVDQLTFEEDHGDANIVPSCIPQCSCEYIKRADALMKRKWLGDYYASARDYLIALNTFGVRSNCGRRALIGIVYALIKLKWLTAANSWLLLLREYHSKYIHEYSKLVDVLDKINSEPTPPSSDSAQNDVTQQQSNDTTPISEKETHWRSIAMDYDSRFVGHCNTTTDIKEAVFIGPTGNFIAAGSDDGALYIWRRDNNHLITALRADSSIVNCVQPHPTTCLIATSGIESVVKLWQPLSNDSTDNDHIVTDIWQAAESNQQRIAMNPFETMIVNLGYEVDMFTPRFQNQVPVCQTS